MLKLMALRHCTDSSRLRRSILLHSELSPSNRIYSVSESVNLENSQFIRCYAVGFRMDIQVGGAVFCTNSKLNSSKCYYFQNYAVYAAALATLSSSLYISDCIFSENSASRDIGAIWSMSNSQTNILNCNFSKNTATTSFGALCVNSSSLLINNCRFEDNTAADISSTIGICNIHNPVFQNSVFKSEISLPIFYFENINNEIIRVNYDSCFFNTGNEDRLMRFYCNTVINIQGCTCGTATKYNTVNAIEGLIVQLNGEIKTSIPNERECYLYFNPPDPTPVHTPFNTPFLTAIPTPFITVEQTPGSSAIETPYQSPLQTVVQTPYGTIYPSPSPSLLPTPSMSPSPSMFPTPTNLMSATPKETPSSSAQKTPSPTESQEQQDETPSLPSLGLGLGLGGGLLLLLILIIIICCCCCKFCKKQCCCCFKCFKCCCKPICKGCCFCPCDDCCQKDDLSDSAINNSNYYNYNGKQHYVIDIEKAQLPKAEECVIVLNPLWRGGSDIVTIDE